MIGMSCQFLRETAPKLLYHFFFFNDTATTEIYTLSLHDALPISYRRRDAASCRPEHRFDLPEPPLRPTRRAGPPGPDRKSTRLNSSHSQISYAVFCLKKKNMPHKILLTLRSTMIELFTMTYPANA